MLRRLGEKRLLFLLLAPAYLALMFDAYVGHELASGGMEQQPQYIPLVLSPIAFVVLAFLGLVATSPRVVSLLTKIVGGLSVLAGLGGMVFHLLMLVEDLGDEEFTWGAVQGALGSGPPLLAPAAFLGLGVLLIALGSPRVRILFGDGGTSSPSSGSAPVTGPSKSERAA